VAALEWDAARVLSSTAAEVISRYRRITTV